MKVIKLQNQLVSELNNACEVCVASAIVSDAGLDILLNAIPENCKVKLLIGIDLPTPVSVFSKLHALTSNKVSTRVFNRAGYFHPKLYLVKNSSTHVFIGSGNLTEGGLNSHIELFHKISDMTAYNDYQSWFDQYYKLGSEITDEWLDGYSELLNERLNIEADDRLKVNDFKRRYSGQTPIVDIKKLSFTYQFFKLHHYLAFEGKKPTQQTKEADSERHEVYAKLLELHERVYPLIQKKGWDLHPHDWDNHIVSSWKHGEHTADSLSALWLHYGRSQPELDRFKQTFNGPQSSLYHMRLQVLLHLRDVSIWLRVGKSNGSIVDRENFKRNMRDVTYKDRFFKLLTSLPKEYSVLINGEWRCVSTFKTPTELHEFVKNDSITSQYFIIGREYLPDATEISDSNIAQTVIDDFERIYPIYLHIKTPI